MFKQTIAIAVVLIALLSALPATRVVAQAQQQQPGTTQVRQSGPRKPPSFQDKAVKPGSLMRGPGMSSMRTGSLAPDAHGRSRHRTARRISSTVGTIVGVLGSILTTRTRDPSSQHFGASAVGTFLSRFCW